MQKVENGLKQQLSRWNEVTVYLLLIILKTEVDWSSRGIGVTASLRLAAAAPVSIYNAARRSPRCQNTGILSDFLLNSFGIWRLLCCWSSEEKKCQTRSFAVTWPLSSPWRETSRRMHWRSKKYELKKDENNDCINMQLGAVCSLRVSGGGNTMVGSFFILQHTKKHGIRSVSEAPTTNRKHGRHGTHCHFDFWCHLFSHF